MEKGTQNKQSDGCQRTYLEQKYFEESSLLMATIFFITCSRHFHRVNKWNRRRHNANENTQINNNNYSFYDKHENWIVKLFTFLKYKQIQCIKSAVKPVLSCDYWLWLWGIECGQFVGFIQFFVRFLWESFRFVRIIGPFWTNFRVWDFTRHGTFTHEYSWKRKQTTIWRKYVSKATIASTFKFVVLVFSNENCKLHWTGDLLRNTFVSSETGEPIPAPYLLLRRKFFFLARWYIVVEEGAAFSAHNFLCCCNSWIRSTIVPWSIGI